MGFYFQLTLTTNHMTELLALRQQELQLACNLNIQKLHIETYSQTIINYMIEIAPAEDTALALNTHN